MSDWAVILGASSGFGGATAKSLAKAGLNIVGVHLDRKATLPNVEAVRREIEKAGRQALFFNINAADAGRRNEVVGKLSEAAGEGGRVKVLLHSLAFGVLKEFFSDDADKIIAQPQIEMTLNVMASSVVYWAQDLHQAGLLRHGSQIFALTSSGGHSQWPFYGAISAAKAALESYMRQIAFELASAGIAANTIQAGVTDTSALRKIPGSSAMIDKALAANPSGRLTLPEDVAAVITQIGLSENTFMTGNTIRVDGGEDITG